MLALNVNTDLPTMDRFPNYEDISPTEEIGDIMATAAPPRNKMLGQVQADSAESSRGPSPQPTHFSVPMAARANGNGHRVLRSATVGYVAPTFVGKLEQMDQGKSRASKLWLLSDADVRVSPWTSQD